MPSRPVPAQDVLEDWCSELVARVVPAGISAASERPAAAPIEERYRLLHRLGAGGIGEVWSAEHVGIGKRVAIKFLRRDLAREPDVRRRFLREGKLAAAVQHPGVVDITDVGEAEDGRVYLVMELLDGVTLEQQVRRDGPLPWARARLVLEPLVRALACAHARGVIHRDLKPSNVMQVVGHDGGTYSKLIDFGMARGHAGIHESVELTRTGVVFGSPAYMSPEQFRGEEADPRSDVYSLGCLIYFVLVGRRPFDGDTPARLMYQHLMTPLPRLGRIDASPSQRAALRRLLTKACAKRPQQRFQSMGEVLEAMAAVDLVAPARSKPVAAARVAGLSLVVALGVVGSVYYGAEPPGPRAPRDAAAATGQGAAAVEAPRRAAGLAPRCGDGDVTGDERCDDGNARAADGCEPDCTVSALVDVQAGLDFTCVLTAAGQVRCWGRQGPHLCLPEHAGNLGDDELPHTRPALHFGPRRATQLSVGFWAQHACVRLDDGTARCWGSDHREQLGLGPGVTHYCDAKDETLASLPALPLPPVESIHGQEIGTCAVAGADPEHRGVYCWGPNGHAQLGLGDRISRPSPPAEPIDLGGAVLRQFAMGIVTMCALLDDGAVRCWGSNRNDQLGLGWPPDRFVGDGIGDGARGALPNSSALYVQGLDDFPVAAVRVNGGWLCVLSTDGRVRCWGANDDGALGYRYDQIDDCSVESRGVRCMVPRPTMDVELGDARIVDLQLGRKRACTLDDAGAVRCWGWGARGGLGYGARLEATTGYTGIGHDLTPAQAYAAMGNDGIVDIGDLDHDGTIDRVTRLAMGYTHACVIVEDGSLRCWGSNSEGQLGYGTTDDVGDDETPGEYYAAHDCGAVPVFGGRGCGGD